MAEQIIYDEEEFFRLWEEPYEWTPEAIEWINTRPKIILDLILEFPPDCKVKGTRPLRHPAPGRIGIVISHFEDGLISVVDPGDKVKAMCEPGWLEVVEYRKGMTKQDIIKKLKWGGLVGNL